MNLATAISDGVLATVTLACVSPLLARRRALGPAALGFALIGAAALCGTARFLGLEALEGLHRGLSEAAAAIAMPTIGAAALALAWARPASRRVWGQRVLVLAALHVAASLAGVTAGYGLASGALGTAAVLVAGVRARSWCPRGGALVIVGAVLVLIAGLVIGTKGELGPFARVDVFHYVLAVADAALAVGLIAAAEATRARPA